TAIVRTLYARIFAITIAIMFASSLIAFVATNVYYHVHLKPINDQKVTHIIQNTVSIYEQSAHQAIDEYLSTLTDLGYQFSLVDQKGNGRCSGNPSGIVTLDQTQIERVLDGEVYRGIANYPWRLFITGFLRNELQNAVGVPIEVDGETHALFTRQ